MILFPPAKINLGLRILRRRPDGYHDLESVFYPVPWCDVLEILPAQKPGCQLRTHGIEIPPSGGGNLVEKAYGLIENWCQKNGKELGGVEVHLLKNIPIGAGLGGGSADAAYMLRALTKPFELNIPSSELHQMAAQLGSDVPFFLQDGPMLATGTGTTLAPIDLDLQGHELLVVYPGLHSSTAEAYGGVKPQEPEESLVEILSEPPKSWQGRLVNDFQLGIAQLYPEVQESLDRLLEAGATYAAMTGSGSACFGFFRKEVPPIAWPDSHKVWQGTL